MPHVHRAAWVLPIVTPPIRDGWVAVEGGRVLAVGASAELPDRGQKPHSRGQTPAGVPQRVILPGLVNAHTHLELSWMKGKVPPGDCMPAWAERLIDLRFTESAGGPESVTAAIDEVR